jgi:hypothetical protein
VTLGVAGFNLLHKFHTEFTPPQALAIPRSGQIELRARF